MREVSTAADYYVIATGASAPQLKALADEVGRRLKEQGVRCHRRAGTPARQWMVLDYIEVVVHLFSPDARAYYALERLWNDAARV